MNRSATNMDNFGLFRHSRNVVKLLILFGLIVGLVAVMAACGGSKQEEPKSSAPAPVTTDTKAPEKAAPEKPKKTSVTVAIPDEPSMLDPQKEDDGNMRAVTESVFEGLVALDGQTLKAVSSLATEHKRLDDLNWTFTLRQGVKFHNGSSFNAEDVVFSIERQISSELKSNIIGYFESIDKVKKIDDYTVQITTKGPDPVFLTRMALLKIMDKDFAMANAAKLVSETNGTGPYKVTKWQRGVIVETEAFNDYWGKKPAVQKVAYRFIKEDATRAAALQTGEVDLAVNMLPEYISKLPKVEKSDGLEFGLLRPNSFKGVMKNPKVRLAAALSIDKEALAQSLYMGYAKVAPGQISKPAYFGYHPGLKPYPYDPIKAKQLLAEAGYKGETIEMIIETGRWLKDRELWETTASMMQQVGLNIKVKMVSFDEWLDILFTRDKAPDLIVSFDSNDIFDADRINGTWVHSEAPASAYTGKLDAKIDGLRSEMDLAKRQKGYEEVAQVIYDDVAIIPLVSVLDIYGLGKDIKYTPRQDGRLAIWNVEIAN